MANDYYTPRSTPVEFTRARAGRIAGESRLVEEGFDRLPTVNRLYGNAHVYSVETETSTANAITLGSLYPQTILEPGLEIVWLIDRENTGPVTLNVDDLGVNPLVEIDGTELAGAELIANRMGHARYDGTEWRLINSASPPAVSLRLGERIRDIAIPVGVAMTDVQLPAARGGRASYTYALSALPDGLTFTAGTRTISGTPTTIGDTRMTLTVTDSRTPNARTHAVRFWIRVQSTVLALPQPEDLRLTSGSFFTFQLPEATGGETPYRYSMNGIPAGLNFDPDNVLRRLFGTPSRPGRYSNVQYFVVDAENTRVQRTFEIEVRNNEALSLPGITDRTVTASVAITDIILPEATGGLPAYTYTLTGLPNGLTFDADSRTISGTTAVTGDHTLTYTVVDQNSIRESITFTLTVATAGRRYIGVIDDGDSVTAGVATAGTSAAQDARILQLPRWSGNKKIVIFQPSANEDLTYISLQGVGNSVSAFTKGTSTITISSVLYEYWVSNSVQGGEAIGGSFLNVQP